MKAKIGDRLVLEGTHVGDDRRTGTIIEIQHPDGSPPYQVRWPDGHESFISPGPDARVEPHESVTEASNPMRPSGPLRWRRPRRA